jgi:hypothetical protein
MMTEATNPVPTPTAFEIAWARFLVLTGDDPQHDDEDALFRVGDVRALMKELEDWRQAARVEASLRRRAYDALREIRDRAPREIQALAELIVGRRDDPDPPAGSPDAP